MIFNGYDHIIDHKLSLYFYILRRLLFLLRSPITKQLATINRCFIDN